jgi:hypothetical protein
MAGKEKRLALIDALSEARGGNQVIAYLTSTRGGLEAQMAMDAIPIIFEHLRAIETPKKETKIDLFLVSNGGEGTVPWRLVTLIREYCDEFNVLVPHNAFSAGTLCALGADKVVMHPMGMLGPTDPTANHPFNPPNPTAPGQVLGISVEDVASYIALVRDDVGIRHEDELVKAFLALADKVHPLALGNVKRATSQSRMMGEKLLNQRKGEEIAIHDLNELIDKLTSQLYFHGHPINRNEAHDDLRLHFVEHAESKVETAMWDLYQAYDADMELSRQFDWVDELSAKGGLPIPAAVGQPPNIIVTQLGPYPFALVESNKRTDTYEVAYEVTSQRDAAGALNNNTLRTSLGWK